MKKMILAVLTLGLALVVGINTISANSIEEKTSSVEEKTVEESYQDALNGISDISIDKLSDVSPRIEVQDRNIFNTDKLNVKEYKTAQILEESDDGSTVMVTVFHNLSVKDTNAIAPAGSRGDEKWDGGYGVQAYNRIYYSTKTEGGIPYGKLTSTTGGWRIADFTYNLTNREIELVTMGFPAGNQVITRNPSGNTYNYSAPSSWDYVNTNALYTLGSTSKVTLKKGSSTWTLGLSNLY